MPLVSLEGISRLYARADADVRALEDVWLDLERGELVTLTGPSGSGKSTLLHVLGLLDTPTAGRYRLGGEDVGGLDDDARAAQRNRSIGFVFQAFHLVPHLTIAENVELPLVYRGQARQDRRRRALAELERVGLADRVAHRPDELSGGEQQRAAIARALVIDPILLLADEPTGNLDEASAAIVLSIFGAVREAGTCVVVVTHNPRVASIGTRGYRLDRGRLEVAP
ncbi:MAG: putative transport system ATP-binding protein [Candidatus Binatota bacterium]|nr:putative transport system ATP-binding protein [Candidatus Binatota bacterium]